MNHDIYPRIFHESRDLPCLVSWRGIIDAGADMVRLYGHFVPKLALNVFMELVPLPSDWDSASCALCNFFMKISLFKSVFLRSTGRSSDKYHENY